MKASETMSAIEVNCDPKEVGLDPDRLGTITRHFDGYVDQGRLAGDLALFLAMAKWHQSRWADHEIVRRISR